MEQLSVIKAVLLCSVFRQKEAIFIQLVYVGFPPILAAGLRLEGKLESWTKRYRHADNGI